MSTQTRPALPVAIIKVNCLNHEGASGINLRTRRMAVPGEQLVHKSLLAESRKTLNRSVIEGPPPPNFVCLVSVGIILLQLQDRASFLRA